MWIGTAGWSLPREMQAHFPGPGTHLERYARVFPCVEINSTFHRPHRPSTFARWAASVPPGFRFSLKLPRTISHTAKLVGARTLVEDFLASVEPLGGGGPVPERKAGVGAELDEHDVLGWDPDLPPSVCRGPGVDGDDAVLGLRPDDSHSPDSVLTHWTCRRREARPPVGSGASSIVRQSLSPSHQV